MPSTPYVLVGLGQTNDYVQDLMVGLPSGQVRGFSQSEISRDAPDYFLSLVRRLGGYLKAVEGIGCALAWRNEIDDCFYDYFAFADSVDKALRRLQSQQERQEQEQNEVYKFMGWRPSLYHDQGETDSDDESGTVPPA